MSHHAWLIVHNSTVGVAVVFPESVEHVWEGTMQTVDFAGDSVALELHWLCQIFTLLQPIGKRETAAVHGVGTNNVGLSSLNFVVNPKLLLKK